MRDCCPVQCCPLVPWNSTHPLPPSVSCCCTSEIPSLGYPGDYFEASYRERERGGGGGGERGEGGGEESE